MNKEAIDRKIQINNFGADFRKMQLRVVDYARVSTMKENQRSSFKNQLETYKDMIENNPNWVYTGTYSDEGITGTRSDIRGGFQDMLSDAKLGKFDLIIVKTISRFARNLKESVNTVDRLAEYGVMVYFDAESINSFDENTKPQFQVFSMAAEWESKAASDRTKIVMQQNIKKGKVYGSDRLLGYNKENCNLTINEEEAEVVRTIYDLYVNHSMGGRRIAKELKARGLTRSDGKAIASSAIAGIIANPKYKGWYCGNKTGKVILGGKVRRVNLDEEQWVMHRDENIPAIVSEDLWDRANEIQKSKVDKILENRKRPINPGTYPYSGKIIHEDRPNTNFSHVNYDYKYKGKVVKREAWQCRHVSEGNLGPTLYSDELDKIIIYSLKEFLVSYDKIVDDMVNIYKVASEEFNVEKEIDKLELEKTKLERNVEKLYSLFFDEIISTNEYKNRREQLDLKISAINEQIEVVKNNNLSSKKLVEHLEAIKEEIKGSVNSVKPSREIIDKFIERIIVKSCSTKKYIELDVILKVLPVTKKFVINRKASREEASKEDLLSSVMEESLHDAHDKMNALINLSVDDKMGVNKENNCANFSFACTNKDSLFYTMCACPLRRRP